MMKFGKSGFSKTQRYLFLVALFAIVLGLVFYGIFKYNLTQQGKDHSELLGQETENLLGESVTSTTSFLDGLPVPMGNASSCAAVMIDNAPEVERQFGLNDARLVYEAPVEGGRTRLMAIYHLATSTEQIIGPVRSARPYYLDWVQELNCLYAHVGGSPEALTRIKNFSIFDLNEFYSGGYFWRNKKYQAPHNTFIDVENLAKAYVQEMEKWKGRAIRSWLFAKKETSTFGGDITVNVDLTELNQVSWGYDKKTKNWERWVNKSPQFDEKNKMIQAKNVVIQYVDAVVADEEGRLDIQTIGSGRAVILKGGYTVEGRWEKKGLQERTIFFGPDTKEIEFNPGTIWVEVVPKK